VTGPHGDEWPFLSTEASFFIAPARKPGGGPFFASVSANPAGALTGMRLRREKRDHPPWVRERRSLCEARVQHARRPAYGVRAPVQRVREMRSRILDLARRKVFACVSILLVAPSAYFATKSCVIN
jgi:hypothetical protein